MLAILQILYYLVLFSMFLMSIFIIFHIVFYSYNVSAKIVTLAIFVPVAAVLMFTNFVLFTNLLQAGVFERLLP